jgi:hypothetical protein
MNRREVLDAASQAVLKDRAATHGDVEDTFGLIADLWNAYLFGGTLERMSGIAPNDVAVMMILLKVARARGNPGHDDNYVDGCGYFSIAAELAANGGEHVD